jgi:hypothetical protein
MSGWMRRFPCYRPMPVCLPTPRVDLIADLDFVFATGEGAHAVGGQPAASEHIQRLGLCRRAHSQPGVRVELDLAAEQERHFGLDLECLLLGCQDVERINPTHQQRRLRWSPANSGRVEILYAFGCHQHQVQVVPVPATVVPLADSTRRVAAAFNGLGNRLRLERGVSRPYNNGLSYWQSPCLATSLCTCE